MEPAGLEIMNDCAGETSSNLIDWPSYCEWARENFRKQMLRYYTRDFSQSRNIFASTAGLQAETGILIPQTLQ
jgi:hypothetical protein